MPAAVDTLGAGNATAAGVACVDREGVVRSLDATAGHALGLDPGALGRRLDELVPAAGEWLPIVRAALDGPGEPRRLPASARPGWSVSVQALPGGALALLLFVDEKPARELAHNLSRHQLLARSTREAVWDWEIEAGTAWWNDRQYEIFGLAPGSVTPSFDAWVAHIHPDDRERVIDNFQVVLASDRTSWSETYRYVRADGKVGMATDRGVVERNAEGAPVRMVGAMTDVTDSVATERALHESETLFRQITETIRDVFWIGAPRARSVLYVSPAWETVWGIPRQALYDDPGVLLASVHPEDRERVAVVLRTSHEDTFDQVFRIIRPDGRVVWIHDRGWPIRDADGNIVRVAGLASDITVERALEERLSHASRLESIGRLAGGLAHDFNNMLTVMLSGAEAAMRRLPPQHRALTDLEDVRDAAERAAELTRQLLVFARQQSVEPALVDLNHLVVRTEGMLRRLLGEPVELALDLCSDKANVWADAGQMEQVLVNLAVNARDAMPVGGMLTLRTEKVRIGFDGRAHGWDAAPGEYVQLSVADNGDGMPPEVLAHVFEPFFTTKGPGRGTGLGLATCYGIVKKAGGQIRVESRAGGGTTFEILLPASAEQALAGEAPTPLAVEGGRETILFVEDQTRLRTVATRILRDAGYDVLSAPGGAEALSMAAEREGEIHLLVTDVIMPRMNGVELAMRLREQRGRLRVLFSSGYPDDALPEDGLPSGMAFLPKPYQGSTLLRTVRAVLDAR